MDSERAVPVIRFVDGKRRVGSGYRIGRGVVLTAAHCVRGIGHRVWLADGERRARVLADGGQSGVDLALVEVVPDAHKGEAPVADVAPALCARVDRATPGKLSDCVAVGYPQHAARQDAPFTTAELDGWIPTASGLVDTPKGRQPGYLVLKAEGSPPRELPTTQPELGVTPWAGMSGAAVFAAGRLVGVVAEHHLPEGDGSLTVVPIEWVDRVQDATDRAVMLQALGVASTGDLEVLRPGATARHRDAEPLEQARAVTAWIDLVPDEDRRASDPDKLHLVTARLNVRNSSKGVISRVAVNNMDIRDEYDDIIDTLGWTGLWLTHVPPGEVGSMETVIQYRGYQRPVIADFYLRFTDAHGRHWMRDSRNDELKQVEKPGRYELDRGGNFYDY